MATAVAPAMAGTSFRKRVYSIDGLRSDLRDLRPIGRAVWAIYGRKRIDPALRERIMVAVAEVNECRFCSYAHHEWALAAGVDEAELDDAGGLTNIGRDPREALAVGYVQARAEANFGPVSPEFEARFCERFTEVERADIENTARIMRIANLMGNTLDALAARRRGAGAPDSRLRDEVAISAMTVAALAIVGTGMSVAYRKSPPRVWRELRTFSDRMEERSLQSTEQDDAAPIPRFA